jgi:hypothetical protein
MNPSIESLVHRILREMPRFKNVVNSDEWPLVSGERLLGEYRNEGAASVGITSIGLRPSKDTLIPYAEIVESRVEGTKTEAEILAIRRRDGAIDRVLFNGGSGKSRDIWEISRFISRVGLARERPSMQVPVK